MLTNCQHSNECKRRKIKCNGQAPCQRCGRQHIECVYADNQRSMGDALYVRLQPGNRARIMNAKLTNTYRTLDRLSRQMTTMQEQIALLSSAVHSLTNSGALPHPDTNTTQPHPQPQTWTRRLSSAKEALTFQGPTTSAFSFDLAKSSLQQRGVIGVVDGDDEDADGDLTQEPSPMPSPPSPARDSVDPLWMIGESEALRLCRVYEEEMGIMYPVLEVEELLGQVHVLYGDGGLDGGILEEGDVHVLRIVLACALAAEASGGSELAVRLFESVRVVADDCVWGAPDINRIIFLTLVVSYLHPTLLLLSDKKVNLLLPNGRRNTRLAHNRHRGTHVSRNRPPPPRNPRPTLPPRLSRQQRPTLPPLLVRLHPRSPLEFRHRNALLPRRKRYRSLASGTRGEEFPVSKGYDSV